MLISAKSLILLISLLFFYTFICAETNFDKHVYIFLQYFSLTNNMKDVVDKFIRKVLAFPEELINHTFYKMKEKASTEQLVQLVEYAENTWITNPPWLPAT